MPNSKPTRKKIIFSGSSHRSLAEEVARCSDISLGKCYCHPFPNGERYVRFAQNIRGADVFLIQTCSDPINDHIMELLVMADAAKRASALNITAVIPFYGYSRQDRKNKGREPISAKLMADLYQAAGLHRIITLDLHNPSIQGFFNFPVDHITAIPILTSYLKKNIQEDGVVVGPDVGGLKRADQLSQILGWPLAVLNKSRASDGQISKIESLVGEVKDKPVIILDDMIDSGGTLIKSAEFLKEKGAKKIMAAATHGIFSKEAPERLNQSIIDEIIITDTMPHEKLPGKFTELTIAPILAETIRRVFNCQSVSSLFKTDDPSC
jgi:ribose-phosphate pyrophosphokinase